MDYYKYLVKYPSYKTIVVLITIFQLFLAIKIQAQPVEDYFDHIKTYDFDQDQKNLIVIEKMVIESTTDCTKKKELAHRLADLLDSDASYACKQFVCRQLAIIGSANEVPVLAKWLADKTMSDMAKYALAHIADASVDNYLREAVDQTSGTQKIGIINTIGMRKDLKSAEKLEKLLYSEELEVRKSAAWALGRIGGVKATQSLRKLLDAGEIKFYFTIADAYLECANSFLKEGNMKSAANIYLEMFGQKHMPMIRAAALSGLEASGHEKASIYVVQALEDDQIAVQRMAARLVQKFPGKNQTKMFANQLTQLSPDGQVLLLNGLKERGDKSAVDEVEAACSSQDESVRCAALEALGKLGDASHVLLLATRAAIETGAEQETARKSLIMLKGDTVADEMILNLATDNPAIQIELISALAVLQSLKAIPELLQAARDSNKNVRQAAFKALGNLAGEENIPDMVELIADARHDIVPEAEEAVVAIARRTKTETACTSIILRKVESLENSVSKISLLRIVGTLGVDNALPFLRAALGGGDKALQAAAIRSLGAWPDASPMGDLLYIIKHSDSRVHRILALRGYINLIGVDADLTVSERLQMYRVAMELAEQDQEKTKVLSELSRISSIESMKMIEPHLHNTSIQAEAAMAIINIARQIYAQDRSYSKELMDWILSHMAVENIRQRAKEVDNLIEELSVYILDWKVSGPYNQENKTGPQLFDVALQPEIDQDEQVPWQFLPVGRDPEKPFFIDLRAVLNDKEDQVAYLKTNLVSDRNQAVLFGIGSDDGIKVWLNNNVIHANNITRSHWQNEDWVNADLEEGINKLMLKVTQHTGGWGVSVSIHRPDTTRVEGVQIYIDPVIK